MKFASLNMYGEVLWCDIKIRNDTLDRGCYWWWLLEEKLHLYLSQETPSDCHVSHKTAVLMMMDSCVSEREKWSLRNWRHLLMMTLRRETLHSGHLHSFVEKLCRTVVLVRKLLCSWILSLVREILIKRYQRPALIWHQDQKRHTWPVSPGLLVIMTSTRRELCKLHL